MALKPLNKYRKVSHVALAKTLKLLLSGPATAHEISEETGLHIVTAQEWMRCLRKEQCIHISGWLPDGLGRDTTAVYQLGKGRDKPRHKFTAAERQARHRQKLKSLSLHQHLAGATHDQVGQDHH
jgi:predicted ArsR family transcriptional regulator